MRAPPECVGAVLLAAVVAGCGAGAGGRSETPADVPVCRSTTEPPRAHPPAGATAAPPFDLDASVGDDGHVSLPTEQPSGARQWAAAGDHARALAYAQNQLKVDPSRPDVWFFTAWEQRALGLLGDAHDSAAECVRLLTEASHPQRLRGCSEIVAQLGPLVGFVSIVPPPGAPNTLELYVSGRRLLPRRWTLPIAVTPGEVEVVARLASGACVRERVRVGAQQSVTVPLEPPGSTPGPDTSNAAAAHGGSSVSAASR